LLGVKQTWAGALHVSAFDPKRTLLWLPQLAEYQGTQCLTHLSLIPLPLYASNEAPGRRAVSHTHKFDAGGHHDQQVNGSHQGALDCGAYEPCAFGWSRQATGKSPLRHVLQTSRAETVRPRHALSAFVLVQRGQAHIRGRA